MEAYVLSDGGLKRFADFSSQCLKPAVGEINQLTDYILTIALKKRGRRAERIELMWLQKDAESRKQAADER